MNAITNALARLKDHQALVVGSDGGSDLVLTGAGVERRHARLSRQRTTFLVQDLDTEGGTFVNDLYWFSVNGKSGVAR